MWKKIGFAFLVIAVGTLAIAWSHRSGPTVDATSAGIDPAELQRNTGPLPDQQIDDRTFVYSK